VGVEIKGEKATLNEVKGNKIGTNECKAKLSNKGDGVFIQDAPENSIFQNLISGDA